MTRTSVILRLALLAPIFSLVGLLLVGCPSPDWPKCENDDHCKSDKEDNPTGKGYVCVFGQCQQCGRDGDCASGEKCQKGMCITGCVDDGDCGEGQACSERGTCEKAKTTAKDPNACVEDGDCQSGFACSNQRCVADSSLATSGSCEREARVQFEFNVYDLSPEARETLDSFAKCMKDNGEWRLTVEGHADDRGTTQYNLDLGDKRARAVADYLSRLGVEKSRVRTVSYGEERPVDSSGSESGWAKNRRGELIIK